MNQQAQAPSPQQEAQPTTTTAVDTSARESMMRKYLDRALQTLQKFGLETRVRKPTS